MTELKELGLANQTLKFWVYAKVIRRGFIDPVTKKLRTLKPFEMQVRLNHLLNSVKWSKTNLDRIQDLQGFIIHRAQEENVYEKVGTDIS